MAKNDPGTGAGVDAAKVDQLLQTETGGRALTGPASVILFIVPLCWSLFQLWIASPLPFILNFGIFNSTEARSIHLAFAVFLAFSAFPMIKGCMPTRCRSMTGYWHLLLRFPRLISLFFITSCLRAQVRPLLWIFGLR